MYRKKVATATLRGSREGKTYLVLEGEVLELLLLLFLQQLQFAQLLLAEIMLVVEALVLLITVDHL